VLREAQDALAASLLADFKAPPPAGLIAGDAGRAAARFLIHRGTIIESLVGALGAAFPVAKKLAGDHNFRVLAGHYVRAHPPLRPELARYGADFADFTADFAAASADLPFLPDLLRLEWALHDAYFAADAPTLTPEALGAVAADALPGLHLALHPAARLVASAEHPIWTIWQSESLPAAPAGGESVLVVRPHDRVEAHALQPGEALFLGSLAAGASLGEAAETAFDAEAELDVAAALAAALARGVFGAELRLSSPGERGVA
jgi:hypothetical protein